REKAEVDRLLEETSRLGRENEALRSTLEDPAAGTGCVPVRDQVTSAFHKLASTRGWASNGHAKLAEVAEAIRDLGEEGLEFLRAQLSARETDQRILAAMMAGSIDDPPLG